MDTANLGRRFPRADSQHNAATVEQVRVESGYDGEGYFVESNTVKNGIARASRKIIISNHL
jgi:hypothetical protein